MVFVICVLLVFNISTDLNAADRSIEYYQQIFDQQYINNKGLLNNMAASGDGNTYYTMQYILDGTLCMYLATQQTKYLEMALGWAETMVAKATIIDNDGYRNWSGTWRSPYSSLSISYEGTDLAGSIELARLARIIKTTPALNAAYGQRADVIGDFVNKFIIDKWFSPSGSGRNILPGTITELNQLRFPGYFFNDKTARLMRILIDMYCTYKNPQIRDIAVKFGDALKDRFQPYKGGLIWDLGIVIPTDPKLSYYIPYTIPSDTSHANVHVAAVIAYYKAGLVFNINYVKGLSNLLTKVIWNGSYDSPAFTNWIDGTNGIFVQEGRGPWAVGLIYAGWVGLGEFDDKVQTIGDAVLMAIMAGKRNPSLDNMNNVCGLMELSGHLALNRKLSVRRERF